MKKSFGFSDQHHGAVPEFPIVAVMQRSAGTWILFINPADDRLIASCQLHAENLIQLMTRTIGKLGICKSARPLDERKEQHPRLYESFSCDDLHSFPVQVLRPR